MIMVIEKGDETFIIKKKKKKKKKIEEFENK
jgi:hypothetical protein